MQQEEYKKILQATYVQFAENESPNNWDDSVSEIMSLPHLEKEEAFVSWSTQVEKSPTLENLLDVKEEEYEVSVNF